MTISQWNDLLKTEQKGRLRAGLTDGSILSLGSNSELRVVQHDAASQQTSLEMNLGKVRSKVVQDHAAEWQVRDEDTERRHWRDRH